jgi:hypothetical protein
MCCFLVPFYLNLNVNALHDDLISSNGVAFFPMTNMPWIYARAIFTDAFETGRAVMRR